MTLTVNASTTIVADQIPAAGTAILYGADNVTVTIDTGINVLSHDDAAIFSFKANSSLVNVGNIASGVTTGAAVYFSGANAFIQNEAGHNISAFGTGVTLNGNSGVFNNYGATNALTKAGVIFDLFAVSSSVANFGDIYGRDEGVWSASSAGGNMITNNGTIRSDNVGVLVSDGTLPTFIINSGTISGSDVAIRATGTAAIEITNTGTLNGSISCAPATGNDTIISSGNINGIVALGDGNDVFNGIGGKVWCDLRPGGQRHARRGQGWRHSVGRGRLRCFQVRQGEGDRQGRQRRRHHGF